MTATTDDRTTVPDRSSESPRPIRQTLWFQKAFLQFVLSALPGGEAINHRLQRPHSDAVRAARRSRIPELVSHIWRLNRVRRIEGASIVDLGTGWDLICSVIFATLGARRIVACDHVPHARFEVVRQVVDALWLDIAGVAAITGESAEDLGRRLGSMRDCTTLDEFLRCANIEYAAPTRIDRIPVDDASIDIVFSYAVLAHPPTELIRSLAHETRRVLAPGGVVSHYIGLQDPFADLHRVAKNVYFLKHSDRFWRLFVNNSINSNNRLRGREHLDILESAGARFVNLEGNINEFDVAMVETMRVAPRFSTMSAEDLAMCQLAIIASFEPVGEGAPRLPVELVWGDRD